MNITLVNQEFFSSIPGIPAASVIYGTYIKPKIFVNREFLLAPRKEQIAIILHEEGHVQSLDARLNPKFKDPAIENLRMECLADAHVVYKGYGKELLDSLEECILYHIKAGDTFSERSAGSIRIRILQRTIKRWEEKEK